MNTIQVNHKESVIPGFNVMEWVRKIREDIYRMEEENPKLYAERMKRIRKKMDKKVPLLKIFDDSM